MRLSNNGLELIKRFEGCRLSAYKCPAGVLTIGYGHTGSDVKAGMRITENEAETLLKKDVSKFESIVAKNYPTATQNQFDALVSICFNCGQGAVLGSIRTLYRQHAWAALKRFWTTHYITASGKQLEGLVKRRAAECDLFFKPTA